MQNQVELKREIMLQINERLYIKGHISKEMYEQAKVKILKVDSDKLGCHKTVARNEAPVTQRQSAREQRRM